MFDKILIANRGEIACRVIRTCRRLGIATVAVYSEADTDALHVREADEAVLIGPPPTAQSYLAVERIVEAIRQTGAQAVHPGFGFLSENTAFARRLESEGVVFIGPGADAIAAMGDKIESKRLAQAAGVSSVPGHLEALSGAAEAERVSAEIGFPVMLKASAGGGGKGMRIARSAAEVRGAFESAANEARSSFGDDRVFAEKYIEQPRHIEIQVLADAHGNVVYLGERECSIQRRHQKVIEEAPSVCLDEQTRRAMGEQACALARAVQYKSVGTVEFIVDKDLGFYFLEMNTRLQVEHPVTEFVTGLDLVEQMIRVAAGEKLAFTQEQVKLDGWAIEARVYAEDPDREFLPAIGRLTRYLPPEGPGVRIDTGVYEGAEISMFYDPMIAKLVVHGRDRADATTRLRDALDAFTIRGLAHNLNFLASLAWHPRFAEGRLTTAFIAEEYPDGYDSSQVPEPLRASLAAVAVLLERRIESLEATVTGQFGRPRPAVAEYVARCGVHGDLGCLRVQPHAGEGEMLVDGQSLELTGDWSPGDSLFRGTLDGRSMPVQVERDGLDWRLSWRGYRLLVRVLRPRAADLTGLMPRKEPPDMSRFLLSPMPGLLARVEVAVGEPVKGGQELAVIEAMKMENVLRAERDGTVKAILAEAGASLEVDQPIIEFE